jgi:hypothetical protein
VVPVSPTIPPQVDDQILDLQFLELGEGGFKKGLDAASWLRLSARPPAGAGNQGNTHRQKTEGHWKREAALSKEQDHRCRDHHQQPTHKLSLPHIILLN